jgi:RND family efflux transporter MFP subunit
LARRKVTIVIIGLVLICIATVVAGKRLGEDKTVITVDAMEVVPGRFSITVSAQGVIEPADTVEARAGITGKVSEIFAREGDTVKVGQQIARLEKPDLEAQLQQAKAQVAAAEADLMQFESQVAVGSGKTLTLRQAETQLQAAKVRLKEVLKGPSEAQIAQAEAQATQADIALRDGMRQLEAMEALYEEGAVSRSAVEDAKARVENAKAQHGAAKKQYEALLDSPDDEQVELAESQVSEAEIALALAKEQEASREKSKDAVEARLAQAKAGLRLVENALAMTMVTSPENGIIINIPIAKGAVVTEGMPIAHIAKAGDMRVRAKVDEMDITGVKVGQPVTFTTDAIWDLEFSGVVLEIAPQAVYEGLTPGFPVLINVEEPGDDLRSGMSADVEIATYSKERTLVLPMQAIVEQDGKEAVFVVDKTDSKARMVQVVTGLSGTIDIEILEGIEEGDLVVTGNYDALKQLRDGKQVRLSNGKQGDTK